jgi:hypothetical protein
MEEGRVVRLSEGGGPCYCSRCSGLKFSEGYDVLQTAEGSLL